MQTPIEELRAATRAVHERLDKLPYARAVLDGSLSIAHYGSFLRALHVVHHALEGSIAQASDSPLRTLFAPEMAKVPALEQDLSALAVDLTEVDRAVLHAQLLAQRIRLFALREPMALVGVLYVLEGSTLGGLVQRAALEQRAELKHALSYLSGYGKDTRSMFQRFIEGLDGVLCSPLKVATAVRGAQVAFEGFERILHAVAPAVSNPSLASALNPEAGQHPVPDDLREVEAALRAGEASLLRFPYYEARYGERGRNYTRSDSAWLATLSREEPGVAQKHVRWLGNVLAARGMPRWLLEQHLCLLQTMLSAALPERASSYQALGAAADDLRRERERALSPHHVAQLSAQFDERVGPTLAAELPGTGALIAAAVADERCAQKEAVPSLTRWLADPARFSAVWVAAVTETLAAARACGNAST